MRISAVVLTALAIGCQNTVWTDPVTRIVSPPISNDAGQDAGAEAGGGPAQLSGYWTPCGELGSGEPSSVSLPAAGDLAAVGYGSSGSGIARVHRVPDGMLVREIRPAWPSTQPVVTLSPDGALLAVSSQAAGAHFGVWHVADGALAWELSGVTGRPAFDVAGDRVLVLVDSSDSAASTAQLRKLGDGALLRSFGAAEAIAFAAQGRQVVTVHDRKVTTWTIGDAGPGITRNIALDSWVALSPAGDLVYGGRKVGSGAQLEVYRLADGVRLWSNASSTDLKGVMSPDQRRLVVWWEDGATAFDVPSGASTTIDLVGGTLTDVALGPDGIPMLLTTQRGAYLRTAGNDQPRLWELGAGQGYPHMSLAISPDGRRLATGSMGGPPNVLVWNLPGRILERTIPEVSTTASVAFSSHGDRLIRSLYDVEEWRVDGEKPEASFNTIGVTWTASYGPNDDEMAVSLLDSDQVLVVPLVGEPHKPRLVIDTHRTPASAAFAPDGTTLATSGPALWRASDGKRLWPSSPPADPAPTSSSGSIALDPWVAFSPRGNMIVVSEFTPEPAINAPWIDASGRDAYRTSTKVYRARDGSLVKDLGSVGRRPAFSPDEAWVAAGGTVYALGEQVNQFQILDRRPGAVSAFAPDGTLAVGGADGVVRLYCPR